MTMLRTMTGLLLASVIVISGCGDKSSDGGGAPGAGSLGGDSVQAASQSANLEAASGKPIEPGFYVTVGKKKNSAHAKYVPMVAVKLQNGELHAYYFTGGNPCHSGLAHVIAGSDARTLSGLSCSDTNVEKVKHKKKKGQKAFVEEISKTSNLEVLAFYRHEKAPLASKVHVSGDGIEAQDVLVKYKKVSENRFKKELSSGAYVNFKKLVKQARALEKADKQVNTLEQTCKELFDSSCSKLRKKE